MRVLRLRYSLTGQVISDKPYNRTTHANVHGMRLSTIHLLFSVDQTVDSFENLF